MTTEIQKESIPNALLNAFHRKWYRSIDWRQDLSWRGVPIFKNPLDLFIYQEIIHETKPDIIIETGTAYGGSALFFRDMLSLIGDGFVISIDLNSVGTIAVPRPNFYGSAEIVSLHGDSADPEIGKAVSAYCHPNRKVMVILDSDHHADHVEKELELYAPLVTPGCHLVVEDTNTTLVLDNYGPGPAAAIGAWRAHSDLADSFKWDETREKFGITFNAWLKRIK